MELGRVAVSRNGAVLVSDSVGHGLSGLIALGPARAQGRQIQNQYNVPYVSFSFSSKQLRVSMQFV